MKKVLIIDEMHESISSMLEEIAYQPTYLPTITRQEILDIIGDFEGIIIRSKTNIDKEIQLIYPDEDNSIFEAIFQSINSLKVMLTEFYNMPLYIMGGMYD